MLSDQTLLYERAQATITTILLVGADAALSQVLVQALSRKAHHHVYLTSDAFGAVRFTHHIKPCLFIVEHRPPILNGIHLYDRLHANRELAAIPAIILNACIEDIQDELATRKLVVFSIPFNLDDFLSKLDEVVARSQHGSPY